MHVLAKKKEDSNKGRGKIDVLPSGLARKKIKAEGGSEALKTYLRNMRVPLYAKAGRVVMTAE